MKCSLQEARNHSEQVWMCSSVRNSTPLSLCEAHLALSRLISMGYFVLLNPGSRGLAPKTTYGQGSGGEPGPHAPGG